MTIEHSQILEAERDPCLPHCLMGWSRSKRDIQFVGGERVDDLFGTEDCHLGRQRNPSFLEVVLIVTLFVSRDGNMDLVLSKVLLGATASQVLSVLSLWLGLRWLWFSQTPGQQRRQRWLGPGLAWPRPRLPHPTEVASSSVLARSKVGERLMLRAGSALSLEVGAWL